MKKTLYSIGVLLVVGMFAYYVAITLSKNDNNNNTNTNTVNETDNWQTYISEDNIFTIKYPLDWEVKTAGYDEVVAGSRNLGFHPKKIEQPSYYFGFAWEQNSSNLDCEKWLENANQKTITEYPFMEEKILSESFPMRHLNINGVDFCRTPDVMVSVSYDERYYIAHNSWMYYIYFPTDLDNPNILDAEKNNQIAHKMLESIEFK